MPTIADIPLLERDPQAWLHDLLKAQGADFRSVEHGVHMEEGRIVCLTAGGQQLEIQVRRSPNRNWNA